MSYFVGGAAIVSAVGGGIMASKASDKAVRASQKGTDAALAENARQFDTVRNDTARQRFIGDSALGVIGRLYGYGDMPSSYTTSGASPTPYGAPRLPDNGFLNEGASAALNPWTVTSKLGDAKFLDPAGAIFGNLAGNTHGDEKRNFEAFIRDNQVMDLGDGWLQTKDGLQFRADQLKDVAGTYYGATYAPDGNQAEWQGRWDALKKTLPIAQAPSAPAGAGSGTPGVPDMSAFIQSPDYQFRLNEGQKALDTSLVARGRALSGQGAKEGLRFGQGLASTEFSSFMDRLFTQAGLGTTGIGASAAAGANAANNNSQLLQNAGNVRANAAISKAEGINNAAVSGVNNLMLMRYLQPNSVSAPTAYAPRTFAPGGVGVQSDNWGYGLPVGSYA